jgi:hypothetical protein
MKYWEGFILGPNCQEQTTQHNNFPTAPMDENSAQPFAITENDPTSEKETHAINFEGFLHHSSSLPKMDDGATNLVLKSNSSENGKSSKRRMHQPDSTAIRNLQSSQWSE